ncbi:ABC transporter substrate-binding protein [Bradyrhizobium erythrophlei]|uniref:Branched-chain amino acid transport system substrate-binding protein n=1 Tax=Bradyrhizobium erythrophlei TaxID=1437360 RepID=A0A1H5J4W9_9BRAD|nr:ABC transporter substrate-binding protein [Bradyrhizobium erythrophlei]SEE47575.1 branched-chain amino acid transport system substrate-binding protein [Bradyrhizobium erythrophlei]
MAKKRTITGVAIALLVGSAMLTPVQAEDVQPVRIGVLTDMSGMYRDIMGPGSVLATRMAVEDFGGKVLDRPIEVISGDHQAKADVGAAIARNWFDNGGADVIVDVAQSAVALAVQELARTRNKIVIHGVTGSPAITQQACAATAFSWSLNAYAISAPLPKPLIERGLDTFFFLSADYSFGKAMEDAAAGAIKAAGGKVLGSVRFPQNNPDFSSFLLQAVASKAKVIWLISAAEDTTNALKQAKEFGIAEGGQHIVVPLTYITNVHALGIANVQGLTFATPFYWDRTDKTRAWSERFFRQHHAMPTMDQAAVYSGTLHYLLAVAAARTLDGMKVADEIRKLPVNDMYVENGFVRADGWLMHPFYMASIKAPSEVKKPWDYYTIEKVIPASEAAQPLSESQCPLVAQSQ